MPPKLEKIKNFDDQNPEVLKKELFDAIGIGKPYYTACSKGRFVRVLKAIAELYFNDKSKKEQFLEKVTQIENNSKKRKLFTNYVKNPWMNLT